MANVTFENACIEFPIFNATGRSLTSSILKVATGGKLDSDPNGRVLVKALTNLTFALHEGDKVALLGHNGAGKSTLLRALARVYAPTRGTAEIVGDIGSLIDISLGINPEATGRENVYIRGQLLGLTKKRFQRNMRKLLSLQSWAILWRCQFVLIHPECTCD